MTDLSEEGAIEGHSVEAVYRPHANIQVHQEPLLLQSVDCGTNPLQKEQTAQQPSVAGASIPPGIAQNLEENFEKNFEKPLFQMYQHRGTSQQCHGKMFFAFTRQRTVAYGVT